MFFNFNKKRDFSIFKGWNSNNLGPYKFSIIFSIYPALGRSVEKINGIDLPYFIAPGLIMMTMLQNSFANSASSIGQSKFHNIIIF